MAVKAGDEILVRDRVTGALVREEVLGDRWLRLAYRPPLRPLCSALCFGRPWLSRLLGWYCDTRWSRGKILPTIQALGIDEREFRAPAASFRSFNEFFARRLREGARPFDPSPTVLCSAADCRMLAYSDLRGDECVPVKGKSFTIRDLLADPQGESECFREGTVVVARLCPADYHRFHYPAGGRRERAWSVPGRVDSVHPVALALGLPVLTENVRCVALLELDVFGRAAFVEVGAFGVARIVETHQGETFRKMDEKGYFAFGGSTIIMTFLPGRVDLAEDLVLNTRAGHETLVRAGETIGQARTAAPQRAGTHA